MSKSSSNISRLWQIVKPYRLKIFLGIFLGFVDALLSAVEPIIFGLMVTEIGHNVVDMMNGVPGAEINKPYIAWVLVIYMVRAIIVQASMYGSNYFITEAVQTAMYDLRSQLVAKINVLPVRYFDAHQFGDLLGRLTSDVEAISNALQQTLMQVVRAFFQITTIIAMMLYLDWQLALIIFITLPLSALAAQVVVRYSQEYFDVQADTLGALNGFVQENMSGFDVLKLYGREAQSIEDFERITGDLASDGFKASFLSSLMTPLIMLVSNLTYGIVLLIGSSKVFGGVLTIGNLQAFTQYVLQINQPMQMLTQLSSMVQSAQAALGRIFQVLDEPSEPDTAVGHLDQPLSGEVVFDHVSFSYVPERPLIEDFNVKVKPGETIAIVGPTGAGKTTMINLLMRFYDVTQGAIRVDGIDIRDLPRQEYRRNFGMVLQDAWLYGGTIRENLRFGNLEATDEEIVQAAKAANVDHFIETLPGGYDMVMNEETSNISLGQKQLLTIARALLSDPKILILDEATSSVDTRLEQLIQKAMQRLTQGRTSFVIAHRLSTIRDADRILVMRDGQIIEHGNHDELMAQEGFYYNLYQSQFQN